MAKHDEVDFAVPTGTSLKATGSGTVVRAGWQNPKNHNEGFGRRVIIDHGKGNVSIVGHPSEVKVREREKVSQGQDTRIRADARALEGIDGRSL